ncbi:MAG: alpha/beta hydrolase family protein [Bryobacteraceae bacterium]
MVEGIHRYLDRAIAEAAARRPAPNRERLRKVLGVVDARVARPVLRPDATLEQPALVARGRGYRAIAVRWPVMGAMEGEGLLLEPERPPVARVVALPDADCTPEMVAGVASGLPLEAQFARRLAESGSLVLVPVLIDRRDEFSANPAIGRRTNQPHREFIYRMAYEAGRHIIGYEVQKVLAAVDWFAGSAPRRPIGVAGYGEGGLIALAAAALDERIDAALVSGYFGPREGMWQEPIYRNVWRYLGDFGDAGVAGLVAPRALIVEAARAPEVAGPPPESKDRRGAAPGRIVTPSLEEARKEVERARRHFERAGAAGRLQFVPGSQHPGSEAALGAFLGALGVHGGLREAGPAPVAARRLGDPRERQRRQFEQMVEFTQAAVRRSESVRKQFWQRADKSSLEAWAKSTEWYRRYFWEEVIGRLPDPSEPLAAETRRIYDEPRWMGYEVLLPVWPDVFAYGILLVPKDLALGERRPAVVCQHGLEGRPQDTIEQRGARVYGRFAARLADEGFVVYAPQNPYIGGDRFRQIQRKANPLGLSLFSFITGQHQRTLEWLRSLNFVDPARIGFYGLSYGGKTAMRVPAILPGYALSICSGDFNEWVWKSTRVDEPFSYMYSGEYEMPEFDLAGTFNYAEMAALIAPRPFMVERGHRDPVGIDEWVAYEYARVRRLYADLRIAERTAIEYFDGPHRINGVGTFEFLRRWLGRPER